MTLEKYFAQYPHFLLIYCVYISPQIPYILLHALMTFIAKTHPLSEDGKYDCHNTDKL